MFRLKIVLAVLAFMLTSCAAQANPANTPIPATSTATAAIPITETPKPTETPTPTPKSELDLPIAANFKDLEALPTLTLEQFNSDAFNKQIIDRNENGMYPDFPADVVVLSSKNPVILWNKDPQFSKWVQLYGGAPLLRYNFANRNEWKAWENPKKRQYQIVERYQIPIPEEGRTDYGVVIRVKNGDGSFGFWKELYVVSRPDQSLGPHYK